MSVLHKKTGFLMIGEFFAPLRWGTVADWTAAILTGTAIFAAVITLRRTNDQVALARNEMRAQADRLLSEQAGHISTWIEWLDIGKDGTPTSFSRILGEQRDEMKSARLELMRALVVQDLRYSTDDDPPTAAEVKGFSTTDRTAIADSWKTWLDLVGDGGVDRLTSAQMAVSLHVGNSSGLPVYNCFIGVATKHQVQDVSSMFEIPALRPHSTIAIPMLLRGRLMLAHLSEATVELPHSYEITLSFIDANGIDWTRNPEGALTHG